MFIESLREELYNKKSISNERALNLCIETEKQLAVFFSHLGFLVKYKMSSIRGIKFLKFKHQLKPNFSFDFVELRFKAHGYSIDTETKIDSVDSSSVILIRERSNSFDYLNLSPFIIDVNSFADKALLADICTFTSVIPAAKIFTYKYIYKSTSSSTLSINDQKTYYKIMKDQLNAFSNLIFKKPFINE